MFRMYPLKTTDLRQVTDNLVSCTGTPRHERGFKLTSLVVIYTKCTGSYKYNHRTIKTTTTLINIKETLHQQYMKCYRIGKNGKQ